MCVRKKMLVVALLERSHVPGVNIRTQHSRRCKHAHVQLRAQLTLGNVGGALGSDEGVGVGGVANNKHLHGLGGDGVEELTLNPQANRKSLSSPAPMTALM
jgi:hypothetical protein